jgi:hypothetical protein
MTFFDKTFNRLRSKSSNWFHAYAQGSKLYYLQETLRQVQISNDYLMSLWLQGRQAHPNPLLQHGQKYFSQSDEDGVLLEILRRIDLTSGVCAEIGCGDGLENNTLNLLARGWRTIWIDATPLAIDPNCNPELLAHSKEFVTAENAVDLIRSGQKKLGVAKLHVLAIDVDGNDGYLARALLEAGILASVVVIEMNEVIPPPIEFTQPYDPTYVWDKSKNHGWSLQSLANLFSQHSYSCVACNLQTGVNAFFVQDRYLDKFLDIPRDLSKIYVGRSIHPFKYRDHRTKLDWRLVEALVRSRRPA